ncbi:hypothetical protein [Pedobacter sp.]|jgi:hypothetical protein|uniref:hypothetical protein n=1 Tax=Pedobacter sp. TaxID=1411316 RepID=UPI002C19BED1|nr:hypothetical protein [Pedobacter sp.]HWW40884.1 hypothetical protein [Pedobacter sp.]
MKTRNLLMTAAFVLAVTSTFAIKTTGATVDYLSWTLAGKCYVGRGTDQQNCDQSYTGAQCTYNGQPAYVYNVIGFPPPTCTIPLRRF